MYSSELFIDVEYQQVCKHKKVVCGDVFLSRRLKQENRTLVVLADGLGSGIKANMLASLTAGMIVNFMSLNEPLERFTETIMKTLPVDPFRKIGYSTFTIIDIDSDGETRIIEYGNPPVLLIRDGELIKPERDLLTLSSKMEHPQNLYSWSFQAQKNDRIIYMTDGISQSGMGRKDMPFGWEISSVESFLKSAIQKHPNMSARDLSKRLSAQAISNDIQKPQDDMTCGVIHFTKARQLLLCTGPPYSRENDKLLAEKVLRFEGTKILCGGTTAEIISRELDREIDVDMESATPTLPPLSKIDGIDLVSEGILTLGRISTLLENNSILDEPEDTPAGKIIQLFIDNDEIYIIVGTKVNNAHQDPTLPVELEIRRNVMKRIAHLLESKFLKRVILEYL